MKESMRRRGEYLAKGQPCPCGRVAVKYMSGWVCARCIEIEAQRARREARLKKLAGDRGDRDTRQLLASTDFYAVHVVSLSEF